MAGKTLETKQIEQQGKLAITKMQEDAETQRSRDANETKITVAALGSKVESLTNLMQLFMEERARLGGQASDAMQAALDRSHEGQMAHGDAMQAALQRRHDASMASGQQQAAMPPPPGQPPMPARPTARGTAGAAEPAAAGTGRQRAAAADVKVSPDSAPNTRGILAPGIGGAGHRVSVAARQFQPWRRDVGSRVADANPNTWKTTW
jgi:hypothetical protein